MDIKNPYSNDRDQPKKKKPENATPKEEEVENKNQYGSLLNDEEEEDEDQTPSLDGDPSDSEYDDEQPWYKTGVGIVGILIGTVVVLAIVWFVFLKKDPPAPPPPAKETSEAVDPTQILKGELYKIGIGKEAIDQKNIYEQGPIESKDFRKDFVNTDSPENYTHPIKIVAVNDSVSYTKHRTMTDDGMDMYWIDAQYKSKKTRFTVPYYIWQTLAPQGVMDVVAEVVTDAEGKTFVTSITAVPPTVKE